MLFFQKIFKVAPLGLFDWILVITTRTKPSGWAALHGGYRGNKYQGPNNTEAIAKLKKLYESEKLDTPGDGKKSVSIQDLCDDLREAWWMWWSEPDDIITSYPDDVDREPYSFPFVQDVLDDSIIVKINGKEWKVPYTVNAVDDYSFASPDKWTQVEESWAEVGEDGALKAGEMICNFGTAVKAKLDGHIGGKCVKFSDEKNLDSTGDYFDKETIYDAKVGVSGPIYLHHTLPIKTGEGNKPRSIGFRNMYT